MPHHIATYAHLLFCLNLTVADKWIFVILLLQLEMPKKPDTTDEQEIRNWRRELFKRKRINSERHSQCCDIELKLSVCYLDLILAIALL